MWVTNTQPYVQNLSGPFTWAGFKAVLGQASQQRPEWLRGPSQRSWREQGGISCSIHPSRIADVQGWRGSGGPAIDAVSAAGPVPRGATELQIEASLSVVLDPTVPNDEARWHAHWEKS